MGIFDRGNKPDAQVYQTGANSRFQNSRAYLLAIIAYMGIFLFGCASSSSARCVDWPGARS
jgi:hypothetical protein